ncbi:MAG TPA: hypothetical protein VFR73_14265 [Hyphomicrobiaceae bacterium]|nr:hypothetical protein [Hyphomicrobiaceae bacterium]
MPRTNSCLAVLLMAASPAYAADQATRADQFAAADLNNDGVLSSSEIGNAKDKISAAIAVKTA